MATTPNALDYLSKATNTPKVNLFDFNTQQSIQRQPIQQVWQSQPIQQPIQQPNIQNQPIQQPQQPNIIQDFLDKSKIMPDFTQHRNTVIKMLKNQESEAFIKDFIQNKINFNWTQNINNIPWWQKQPKQSIFDKVSYTPFSQEQLTSPNQTSWQALSKYGANVVGWLYNIIPWVAKLWTSLVKWTATDIWQHIWNLFWLVKDKNFKAYQNWKSTQTSKMLGWLVDHYKTTYWSVNGFNKALVEDPTAIISDALTVFWVWLAWKAKLNSVQKTSLQKEKKKIINKVKNANTLEQKSALIRQWILKSKEIATKTKQLETARQWANTVFKVDPYAAVPTSITKWVIKGAGWAGTAIKTTWKAIWKIPKTIKQWIWSTADIIDTWIEKTATKILWSSDWTKELFKATSPSYNTLSKNKDITKIINNAKKADEAIINYWFKPTNTTERVKAYNNTMKKVWNDISKTRSKANTKFDAWNIAKIIDNEIQKLSVWWVVNPAIQKDVNALKWQSEYFQKIWKIDIPTLWNQRTLINAITDWGKTTEFWNTFSNVMKKVSWQIKKIEDDILTKAGQWAVWDKLRQYGALRSMYDDIVKQDIKALRAKWMSLDESFWRISWISEALWWIVQLFTNPKQALPSFISWWSKLLLWKTAWKLKNVDFLIKNWYDKLYKNLNPKILEKSKKSTTKTNTKPVTKKVADKKEVSKTPKVIKKPTIKKAINNKAWFINPQSIINWKKW